MSERRFRRPPGLAVALIRLALPQGEVRDAILGDLAQEFYELSDARGGGFAARWYWRQALGVVKHSLSDQMAGRSWSRPEGGELGRILSSSSFRLSPRLAVSHLAQDIRYALRQLARRPGFTLIAILSLALDIGANTAIFSLADSLLVRPLGVTEPDRLTPVFTSQVGGQLHGNTSYPDYLDYKERNEAFSGLAAVALAPMSLTGDGQPWVTWGQAVSGDYFSVLGVEPPLGRGFLPEEDGVFGAHAVAVISHATWQHQFGSDPNVLGKSIRINDFPFTVVGVAPPGFAGLMPILEPAVWVPLAMVDQALPYSPNIQSRIDPWLQLVGRLKPGLDVSGAQASMELLAANLAAEFPETNRNKGIVVRTLDAGRLGAPEATKGARTVLNIFLGVVGFVLLIACFNVANLELVKAAGRRREIALRHFLGASRFRIVRQLLVESMLLALFAGAVGLLVAVLTVDALQLLQTQIEVSIPLEVSLDRRVLGFTFLLALSTGVLFGLAPALQVLKPGQSDALKEQGLALSHSRKGGRLQNTLVVAQVALSLVLLTGAGLLIKSLGNTLEIDPGFNLRSGVVVPLNLGYGQYDEVAGRALQRSLLDRVVARSGVESAALTSFMPLGLNHGRHDVVVEGYEPAPDEFMLVMRNMVSANYFETMGIRVLSGRAIDEGDTEASAPVAMVNEAMANRFWPDQDPIGRTVQADLGIVYTVVGIVENGKYSSLRDSAEPYLILPMSQAEYVERVNLIVKTEGDPRAIIRGLASEVQSVAPGLPPPSVVTIPRYLEYSQGDARAPAIMVGVFGLLALVLAAVGLYGVMAYSVNQRIREFGVRMAVGATMSGVVKMVLIRGLKTTLAGLVIGGLLALAVTPVLSGVLYQVSPLDPAVFALGIAVLLVVGQVASYLPARLASKADPVVALKAE